CAKLVCFTLCRWVRKIGISDGEISVQPNSFNKGLMGRRQNNMCMQPNRAVEGRMIGCNEQAEQILNLSLAAIEIEGNRLASVSSYAAPSVQISAKKVRLCGFNNNVS